MFRIILLTLVLVSFSNFKLSGQVNKNIYIFGHSLIVHDPPAIPTPSNETTVPHWLHFLAQAQSNTIAVSGQYGFLPQHDNLPPFSQWGFDVVTPAWESDTETFAEANFDTTLITAGNFIQYQPSNVPYFNEPDTTPVSATLSIIDWLTSQNTDMQIFIYENWPDMASFLSNGFPATPTEFETYNDYTENAFNDWWLEYQDFLVAARPDEIIKMIPVGPVISKLLREAPFNQIPITDLYEDDAPHGRPTIYFLAAMVTYTAMYQSPAPSNFVPPNTINSIVASNYNDIADFIWNELNNFNFDVGNSRVFVNSALHTNDVVKNEVKIFPNPTTGNLYLSSEKMIVNVACYDILGNRVDISYSELNHTIDTSHLSAGVWFLKVNDGASSLIKKFIKL